MHWIVIGSGLCKCRGDSYFGHFRTTHRHHHALFGFCAQTHSIHSRRKVDLYRLYHCAALGFCSFYRRQSLSDKSSQYVYRICFGQIFPSNTQRLSLARRQFFSAFGFLHPFSLSSWVSNELSRCFGHHQNSSPSPKALERSIP